jgi:antitoxin component YwqK of YwqJK toxin-antitoxin module
MHGEILITAPCGGIATVAWRPQNLGIMGFSMLVVGEREVGMRCGFVLLALGAMLGFAVLGSGVGRADMSVVRFSNSKTEAGSAREEAGGTHADTAESTESSTSDTTDDSLESAQADGQTELVTVNYDNGKVKIKKHVVQDERRNYLNHGPWTMWDPQGNVIATGHFAMGKRHGTWSRLQPEKSKPFDGPAYKEFRAPFVWEARFDRDVLHGVWLVLDAEGRPVHTWEFDHGRLHGKVVDWHANGRKRREAKYQQGVLEGESLEWDAQGKLIKKHIYLDGRRHRPYEKNHPSGQVAIKGWLLGPRETVRVVFNWWQGSVRIETTMAEGKDERHGKWTYYYADGTRKYEGDFEHTQPAGMHSWWHPNGHMRMQGAFADGKESGEWSWWHANGQKEQSGQYVAGERTGQWITWDRYGKVTKVQNHSTQVSRIRAKPLEVDVPSPVPAARVAMQPQHPAGTTPTQDTPEILQRWTERNGAVRR